MQGPFPCDVIISVGFKKSGKEMNKEDEVDLKVRLEVLESELQSLKKNAALFIKILAGAAALPNAPDVISTLAKVFHP
jgi:hypothetical protein